MRQLQQNRVIVILVAAATLVSLGACTEGFNTTIDPESAALASKPPKITFTTPPSAIVTTTTLQIGFKVVANQFATLAKAEYSLNGGPLAQTTTLGSIALSGLTEGQQTLLLRVLDSRGNIEEGTLEFQVDTVVPLVVITQSPVALSNLTQATVAFMATDATSGVLKSECSLNGAAFTDCRSPLTLTQLTARAHELKVRARDRAGHVSLERTVNWTVDLARPTVAISQTPPAQSPTTSATFAFTGTDNTAVAGFECRIDNQVFTACTSPRNYTALAQGAHSFAVRSRDTAGNLSTPATFAWTIVAPPGPTQMLWTVKLTQFNP